MKCLAEIERQVSLLHKMREDSTSGFADMVQQAEALLDEPLRPPRICGTHRHRNSRVTVAESAEDYYRRTVYIPFLDNIIAQFNERFLSHKNTAVRLNALLPGHISDTTFDSLTEALTMYLPVMSNDDGPDIHDVQVEFVRWQSR